MEEYSHLFAGDDPNFEEPREMSQALGELDLKVARQGELLPSGRHLGYMPGGGMRSAALADYLAAAINPQSGERVEAKEDVVYHASIWFFIQACSRQPPGLLCWRSKCCLGWRAWSATTSRPQTET